MDDDWTGRSYYGDDGMMSSNFDPTSGHDDVFGPNGDGKVDLGGVANDSTVNTPEEDNDASQNSAWSYGTTWVQAQQEKIRKRRLEERKKLGFRETRIVRNWRVLTLLMILIIGALVSTLTYKNLKSQEDAEATYAVCLLRCE